MDIKKQITQAVADVPMLSHSSSQLLKIIASDGYNIKDVTTIVEMDHVLSAKLLKTVNSAAFSLSRDITSISEAIPYLGNQLILSLALDSSAAHVLKKAMPGYGSLQGELFKHCLKTALAARELSPFSKKPIDPGVAYTCGLLHDIGKTLISSFLTQKSSRIASKLNENPDMEYLQIERNYLGITHSEAGYLLTRHWKLPEIFSQIALYHHNPEEAKEEFRSISYLIHIADISAMMTGAGTGMDTLHYSLSEDFTDFIPVDDNNFQKVILATEEHFQKSVELFQ